MICAWQDAGLCHSFCTACWSVGASCAETLHRHLFMRGLHSMPLDLISPCHFWFTPGRRRAPHQSCTCMTRNLISAWHSQLSPRWGAAPHQSCRLTPGWRGAPDASFRSTGGFGAASVWSPFRLLHLLFCASWRSFPRRCITVVNHSDRCLACGSSCCFAALALEEGVAIRAMRGAPGRGAPIAQLDAADQSRGRVTAEVVDFFDVGLDGNHRILIGTHGEVLRCHGQRQDGGDAWRIQRSAGQSGGIIGSTIAREGERGHEEWS
mmetsp:Transcript_57070/g.135753  ORF Transcript_57070/g.135753 Transcript_57070/m.135753 type:complete len:265 (-) Transcript_57070:637-1431(-)